MTNGTSPAEVAGSWIGPLIGIGFAAATLRMLDRVSPRYRNPLGELLSKSKKVNGDWMVRVYNKNLNRAKLLLKIGNFKIIGVYKSAPGISYIKFEERY